MCSRHFRCPSAFPFVNQGAADFAPLLKALLFMALVYYIGVFCTWAYNYVMIYVSQGMLKTVRDDLFSHMERLPVRYFDIKSHGDIMSIYTNDTDTLRQVVSQSFPQMLSAVITIVGVFVSMLVLSIPLTLITVVMIACMVFATKTISSKSGYYFVKQQTDIGNVNGYIEEMMEGQKVVKVFCHEDTCIKDFKALNQKLRDSANHANRYASILMPVLGNLGYVSYAVIAMVGAGMAIFGNQMTLGTLASFLQFSRSFNQPISQLSQQLNSIIMAIAGAERIFGLLDEEPEQDGGYVILSVLPTHFQCCVLRCRTAC